MDRLHYCVLQVGPLENSGNGVLLLEPTGLDPSLLTLNRHDTNQKVLKKLRLDTHADELLAMCNDEAAMDRMSLPRELTDSDMVNRTLSPRFAVEQGMQSYRIRSAKYDSTALSLLQASVQTAL